MNNTNKNNNLSCDIVRDLLPLYHDDVVSEVTKKTVEEHLAECESCKKEYEELSIELPIQNTENNTKNKFKALMSRQKIKRILILIASIVLTCVLVISAVIVLTEVPCVKIPDSEIQVIKSYGYETEDGYEFFILYDMSMYESMLLGMGEHANGIQNLEAKRPIISDKIGSDESIWVFSYAYPQESGEELDYLCFAGETIWSKEKNSDDEIPEYVFEYSSEDCVEHELNVKENYIELIYNDYTHKRWTLDGELIQEVKIYQK